MSSSRKPRKQSGQDVHPSLAQYRQKERGERLQKVLADAGVAARRECEALIIEGAVTVNGKTIDTLPAWVDPASDRIEVYGRPLRAPEKHVYIILFKPRGTVCTNSDPEGRPRAIDLVNHASQARLYCVGRLDLDSSGLLLLTNDGDFANRLTHPRYEVTKGYDLTLDGKLDANAIAEIERQIFTPTRAGEAPRSSFKLISADAEKSVVHMQLCEHRNMQIKPLMLSLGFPVKKMRRTSFGPIRLKGLGVGEWRELTGREVEMLRRASRGESAGAPAPEASAVKFPSKFTKQFADDRVQRRLAKEAAKAKEALKPKPTSKSKSKDAPRDAASAPSAAPSRFAAQEGESRNMGGSKFTPKFKPKSNVKSKAAGTGGRPARFNSPSRSEGRGASSRGGSSNARGASSNARGAGGRGSSTSGRSSGSTSRSTGSTSRGAGSTSRGPSRRGPR